MFVGCGLFYAISLFCLTNGFVLFFISEPEALPSNVQGHNTSSTSILVQWENIAAADQNGIILSYTVTYKALPDGEPRTKLVSARRTQVTLTGLHEYTNYNITVLASTVKGDGPTSVPTVVITDEDTLTFDQS